MNTRRDPTVVLQLGEGVAGTGGQSRRRVIQKPDEGGPDLPRGWRNHQPILGQQPPNLIDDGGPMFHEERPCAVHSLQVGLLHRLDRDTAHGGPTHRFADRFRIAPIVLVGLDVGLDVLGMHQLEGMPELFKRPTQCCALPQASILIT